MAFDIALQLVFNAIIAGGIYSLIAIGFSMSWKLLRFINFAHGALYMLGAYMAFVFLDFGIVPAFLLSLIVVAAVGVIIDFIVYKPLRLRKSSSLILLLASVGVFLFLENLVIAVFGAEVRTLRTGPIQQGMNFFGAIITPIQVVIIIVAIATLVLLHTFLKRTKLGKAMRATSDNKNIASTIGINVERIVLYTTMIAAVLAAAAGVLVGLEQNLEPTMGLPAVVKGFTSAIVGGFGSISGAVAGGYLLGFAENIGIYFLPSGYKDAIGFVILIIFLLFRPRGMLGKKENV